ncbi:hypothetical protein K1J50_05380, partial [Caldovatus sp. SYSU G05006]|nr:hypothetical protein [Caldovatus aquaticus]
MLRPRVRCDGSPGEARGWPPANQAPQPAGGRARGAVLLAALALGGCGVLPDEINPVVIWSHATGASAADRLPPPRLDEPYPDLGTVPPRPDRPDPQAREALTAALAAERARAREP